MNAAWLSLCGLGLLGVWLLRDAITDMCKEEIKTRLSRLPYALLRVVALRIPRAERQDVIGEWRAELDFILDETDGLPLTRLLRGIHYSASLLGLMLPFATIRDLIAAYWWRMASRRLHRVAWMSGYLRTAVAMDGVSALVGGLLAFRISFNTHSSVAPTYLAINLGLPLIWMFAIGLAGGYDDRIIGAGSDEFRKILNAAVGLTAAIAIFSYAINVELSRVYLVMVLSSVTLFDLVARYAMRKRLYRLRAAGRYMLNVVVVGHESAVVNLITELRRDRYHGFSVVAACVAHPSGRREIAGVPVHGGLDDVTAAVRAFAADTVAVLACPEMNGVKLRELAWELEKTGTDLCVSPALLDVAGPQATVRPTVGMTLLHVDHPQLDGVRLVIKDLFDRCVAGTALVILSPLFAALAAAIWLSDRGPVFFTHVRVGKDGRAFKIYKFRTLIFNAEHHKAQLLEENDLDGVPFKLRDDPRVTKVGAHLRRWSIDDLPQLFNVFLGDMSLVGPRPALPDEAAKYADYVRRRLVVKPGLTGLWQVIGRSDLSWDESVRLDLRYVENWSFALDLQILWRTGVAWFNGSGAY